MLWYGVRVTELSPDLIVVSNHMLMYEQNNRIESEIFRIIVLSIMFVSMCSVSVSVILDMLSDAMLFSHHR